MSSRAERVRRQVVESGSTLRKHSMNQAKIKLGLEGEARLGLKRNPSKSEFAQFLETISREDAYQYFFGMIEEYDRQSLPIPKRVGNLAFEICSLINTWMRDDTEKFLSLENVPHVRLSVGSPNANLIPVSAMVPAVIKELGYKVNPENVRNLNGVAQTFAENLGAVRFYETGEVAAIDAFCALYNLSSYIASQVNAGDIDVKHARRGVFIFGQTIRAKLSKR